MFLFVKITTRGSIILRRRRKNVGMNKMEKIKPQIFQTMNSYRSSNLSLILKIHNIRCQRYTDCGKVSILLFSFNRIEMILNTQERQTTFWKYQDRVELYWIIVI